MVKKIKKILISLCVISLLFTSMPIKSYGFDGGKLFEPITELLTGLGDAVINILQDIFLPGEGDAIVYEGDAGSNFVDWWYNIPIVGNVSGFVSNIVWGSRNRRRSGGIC